MEQEAAQSGCAGSSVSPSMGETPLHTVLILTGLKNRVIQILLLVSYRNPVCISISTKGDLLRGVWGSSVEELPGQL